MLVPMGRLGIAKHRPGGVDHDQKTHGRRGMGIGSPRVSPTDEDFEEGKATDASRTGATFARPNKPFPGLTLDDNGFAFTTTQRNPPVLAVNQGGPDIISYSTNMDAELAYHEAMDHDPLGGIQALAAHHQVLSERVKAALSAPDQVMTEATGSVFGAQPSKKRGDYLASDEWTQMTFELHSVNRLMEESFELGGMDALIERGHIVRAEISAAIEEQGVGTREREEWKILRPGETDDAPKRFYVLSRSYDIEAIPDLVETVRERLPELVPQAEKVEKAITAQKAKSARNHDVYQFLRNLRDEPPIQEGYTEIYALPKDMFVLGKYGSQGPEGYDDAVALTIDLDELGIESMHTKSRDISMIEVPDDVYLERRSGMFFEDRTPPPPDKPSYATWGHLTPREDGGVRNFRLNSFVDMVDPKLGRAKSVMDIADTLTPQVLKNNDPESYIRLARLAAVQPEMYFMSKATMMGVISQENTKSHNAAMRARKKVQQLSSDFAAAVRKTANRESAVIGVLAEHRAMGGKLDLLNKRESQSTRQLQMAASVYPADWIDTSNAAGPIRVQGRAGARAYFYNERRNAKGGPVETYMDNTRTYNPETKTYEIKGTEERTRPTASWERHMVVDPGGVLSTDTVHELHHNMEHNVPALRQAERVFYDYRTRGEAPVKLSSVQPGRRYKNHEFTKLDKWGTPYMGKSYERGGISKPHRGTGSLTSSEAYEMFSTGYPVILGRSSYALDEEHEAFLLGLLVTI